LRKRAEYKTIMTEAYIYKRIAVASYLSSAVRKTGCIQPGGEDLRTSDEGQS